MSFEGSIRLAYELSEKGKEIQSMKQK